ncbi:MAG TPA: DUF4382 domain-containing protein [bacterium]
MILLTIVGALFISGCSEDSSTSDGGGMGQIRMYVLDAPATYEAVNIVVTEVEVHQADADSESGWWVVNDSTATYDLLELTNGANAILADEQLPAGHYTQIRLHLGAGSNVVVDGIPYDLEIPSGMQSGLKLNHPFDIEAGVLYELTLDFDAEQSINQTGTGQYMMNPVIRVVANAISGTVSGIIDPPSAQARVWTIAGTDTISAWADTSSGGFMLMAVPEGEYDVIITPNVVTYNDTTITGVVVEAQQNTNLGTIHLTSG